MSVIIRLQNLPWSANALDIRQFFQGLSIPEGGVHIVGGEQGDAFIAFSTDEDARQAFNRNGGKIKEIQIKLMLSSRTEMQKVIEAARNPLAAFMQTPQTNPPLTPIMPAVVPAAVPEVKKDDNSKDKDRRSRRRSRSRSRDRKDRSRDRDRRDRRRRDRTRSRSRDRRDRRRRDRSRSRDRTRSKERDRRSKDRKRSEEKTNPSLGNSNKPAVIGVWEPPPMDQPPLLMANQQHAVGLLNNLVGNSLEELRRNMTGLKPLGGLTDKPDFQANPNLLLQPNRESWPPGGLPFRPDGRLNFQNMPNRSADDTNLNSMGNRLFNNRMDGNGPQPRSLLGRPMNKFNPMNDRQQNTPMQNSCVQVQPFYGGYSEIRRFFHGLFINNTGIKFVNDEYGKRTGITYVRFFYPEDKEVALTKDGGMIRGNVVEVKHLDDEVFNETVDRYVPDEQKDGEVGHQGGGGGGPPQNFRGGRNGRNFVRGSQQPNFIPSPKVFSCLVVEDLPSYAKEQDILKIFGEYPLMSIIMTNKHKCHMAYVKFSNSDDAKKALSEKQVQAFDGKPVNVRACSDDEFNKISREQDDEEEENENDDDVQIVEEKEFPSVESTFIDISGLPLKTTDRDIVDFFSDIGVAPEKIHLLSNHLGFTGTAYCEFASLQDAAAAVEKDGIPLGPKEVSITSISKEEMESRLGILSQSAPPPVPIIHPPVPHFFPRNNFMPRGMGPRGFMRRFHHPHMLPPPQHGGDVGIPGCTVLMENVPYKAGLDEILQFFDGFDIPPDNVLRRYNENGTPSGEAKVIFTNHDQAKKAVEQKRFHKIRERTIYLTLC
ncbi:uncharacterized protein LOC108742772 [Agrilus planipennis]|uniref:Uncharacterized protein LOC108742772 n=1 Tax=Agrilus planipennis TaxID=224129 RepID=A0A1W4XBV2_AGRPL|nr:uncharacterized protein LOC108742772 [Agrilus planipennis]